MITVGSELDQENNENHASPSISNSDEEYEEDFIILSNGTRKIINKSAYFKLHKLPENSECRLSSESLQKYEKFTAAQTIPIPKPRTKLKKIVEHEDIEYIPCVIRSESVDTIDKIEKDLSEFVMDNRKKEKKRTNSFRKLFPFFGKKKEKEVVQRKPKQDVTENYQNETFVRNTPQRHTISCERIKNKEPPPEVVQRYANEHINKFNQIRDSFEKPNDTITQNNTITKYIDTSSSSTLESKQNTYQNALIAQAEKHLLRSNSLRRDTPPRAQDTIQTVNIVKPKARLPINSYRTPPSTEPTPSPHLNEIYGTVFDAVERIPSSPTPRLQPSPSLENSKLKLPSNREILPSQPRIIRSPLLTSKISPEKIIATELLKGTNTKTPENEINERLQNLSFGTRTSSRSTVTISPSPHVEVDNSPDVEMRQKYGRKLGPPSPSKDEIRRSVEAYYWKEIKKIKEQEDYEIYMSQFEFSHVGFPEDPRRSRCQQMYDNNRCRRSSSVPRNSRQQLSFDSKDQRVFIPENPGVIYGYSTKPTTKPIFRRGSLSTPIQTIQSNKKVSFSNSSQSQNWPTKNGFTKSPPQRRLDRVTLEDDVFQSPPQFQTTNPQAIYVQHWEMQQNRPVYAQKPEAIYGQRFYRTMSRQEMENLRNQARPRHVPEQLYGYAPGAVRRDVQENIYGYRVSNEPTYGYVESPYGIKTKQFTVRNKVCDIYGNIHDVRDVEADGVLMGKLHNSSPVTNFMRGTRLTSSSNDMSSRRRNDLNGGVVVLSPPVRPLPPLPPSGKNSRVDNSNNSNTDVPKYSWRKMN